MTVKRRLSSIFQALGPGGCDRSDQTAPVSQSSVSGDDGVPTVKIPLPLPLPRRLLPLTRPPGAQITAVRAIKTAPYGARLVVVKIETSVPGLTGVGCATFTQRSSLVAAAVEEYLEPFLLGRRTSEIEDIWQSSYVSSYWRSGPVLNNALSGVDQVR